MALFDSMSLVELKEEAKNRGLKGVSRLKKNELIEKLKESEAAAAPSTKSSTRKKKSSAEKVSEEKPKNEKTKKSSAESKSDVSQESSFSKTVTKGVSDASPSVKTDNNTDKNKDGFSFNNSGYNYNNASNASNGGYSNSGYNNSNNSGYNNNGGYSSGYSASGSNPYSNNYGNTNSGSSNNSYNGGYSSNYNNYSGNNSANNSGGYNNSNYSQNNANNNNRGNYRNDYQRGGYRNDYQRGNYQKTDYQKNDFQRNDYQRNDFGRNDYQRNDYQRNNEYGRNDRNAQQHGYVSDRAEGNVSKPAVRVNAQEADTHRNEMPQDTKPINPLDIKALDSGETKEGILEVMADGYGFIRCDNYLPGTNDVYVSPSMIRKWNLRTGDIIKGNIRIKNMNEKFSALLYISDINGHKPEEFVNRAKFDNLTPIFPDERIRLETPGCSIAMRMMDIISPIGMGQRGMIVSQPKTGKTTLIKQVAKSIKHNYPKMHIIVLLIDERPEEVTDIKESIMGNNVEVIYSTFDELPENHKRVSEMVIERAKRLVEQGEDVIILMDSITRLARAYNLTVTPSGRTLSGGLDPAALHMPKKFFGAARNMREGGSLTILATALVDTGSKMDDVVFEEFKGTGNMELVLDRSLSEKRLFPAIDFTKSSTRREDLLLRQDEMEASLLVRRAIALSKNSDDVIEKIIRMYKQTKDNFEFINLIRKVKLV